MIPARDIRKVRKALPAPQPGVVRIFRALGDATRFRMYSLLLARRDLCVTEIAHIFNVSVPAASQQLHVLEDAGLIMRERRGQMICYCAQRANPAAVVIGKLIRHKQPLTP